MKKLTALLVVVGLPACSPELMDGGDGSRYSLPRTGTSLPARTPGSGPSAESSARQTDESPRYSLPRTGHSLPSRTPESAGAVASARGAGRYSAPRTGFSFPKR